MMISLIILFLFQSNAHAGMDLAKLNPNCTPGGYFLNELLMKFSSSENPYADSCSYIDFEKGEISEARSLKEDMKLNVYMQKLPEKTPGGASLRDFFAELKKKIFVKIKAERKKMKEAQECLSKKTVNECIPVPEHTLQSLGIENPKDYLFTDVIKDARFNLVLASRPASLWGTMRDDPRVLNANMHDLGIYKKQRWDMSLGDETKEARDVLNGYFDEANKNAADNKARYEEVKKKIAEQKRKVQIAREKIAQAKKALAAQRATLSPQKLAQIQEQIKSSESALKAGVEVLKELENADFEVRHVRNIEDLEKELKKEEELLKKERARQSQLPENQGLTKKKFNEIPEIKELTGRIEDIENEIDSEEASIKQGRRRFSPQSIVNEKRQEHYATYSLLMGSHPMLQFIESENPTKKDIVDAISKTMKSLDEEEKWINETTESLDSNERLSKDLLKLMFYNSEVKSILGEKGEYCGMARDLVTLQEAKNLGFDIGVYLPVMVGSIVAPYLSVPLRSAAFMIAGVGTLGTSAVVSGIKQDRVDKAAFDVVGRFNPDDTQDDMNARFDRLSMLSTDRDLELFFGVLGATDIRAAFKAKQAVADAKFAAWAQMKSGEKTFINDYTILTRTRLHGPMGKASSSPKKSVDRP